MLYQDDYIGFSFELPDGWTRSSFTRPITFFAANHSGTIEVQTGGIAPQYLDPANRERYLAEPGATVKRTTVGGERNAVVLRRSNDSEISVVREGIQYSISHSNNSVTEEAIGRA